MKYSLATAFGLLITLSSHAMEPALTNSTQSENISSKSQRHAETPLTKQEIKDLIEEKVALSERRYRHRRKQCLEGVTGIGASVATGTCAACIGGCLFHSIGWWILGIVGPLTGAGICLQAYSCDQLKASGECEFCECRKTFED